MLPRRLALLTLAALLAAGACAAKDDPSVVESGTDTTTGAHPTTTSVASGFGTSTVSTPPVERGLLKAVDATAAGDVDRVTFTFEGALPGYRVGFVERPVIADGSGEEVTVDGVAVLQVHFEPASGFDLTGEGRQVYSGPTRLDLATHRVLDAVRTGDFEANLEWVLGLDTKAPFRVRTDTSPNRVIVEVQVSP